LRLPFVTVFLHQAPLPKRPFDNAHLSAGRWRSPNTATAGADFLPPAAPFLAAQESPLTPSFTFVSG
jgi:hypothetical protein